MPSALRRAISGVRWYIRELTDESGYERYVAHVRGSRPDAPLPSRRAFERARTGRRDRDPREGFRCC
jgi:uncharacterized short protein YbdD (DUF466 family)